MYKGEKKTHGVIKKFFSHAIGECGYLLLCSSRGGVSVVISCGLVRIILFPNTIQLAGLLCGYLGRFVVAYN